MFNNFWERIWQTLFDNFDFLLNALGQTLIIAFWGFTIGLFIATIVAVSLTHQKPSRAIKLTNKVFDVLIWIIRGTPIVVMLLLMYFVILSQLRLDAIIIAIFAFSLYCGAYMTEILRGAINGIDKNQFEAGRALGLSNWYIMWKIVLPQAYKNATRSLGNISIMTVKDTSIVSFITIIDITRATQLIIMRTYDAIAPYILLALIYLAIVGILTLGIKGVEKWLSFKSKI